MAARDFDFLIIGAGSGGLIAAGFAARLGARVALIEKNRIGGDCTWTGCVPSKALLHAAKAVHVAHSATRFGIACTGSAVEMSKVREYVRNAIQQVYSFETAAELRKQGIEVFESAARFLDAHTVSAGEQILRSKKFLIATGARARIPAIAGLNEAPFLTYEQIFENDRLPQRMVIIGAGPLGLEIAQAYQRLGARVTVVVERLLPRDEPEASETIRRVLASEGVRFIEGRVQSVRKEGGQIVVAAGAEAARCDVLLLATGRAPNVAGLDLEKAGVAYSEAGIPVDRRLRTNVKHIYAAGDVLGGLQFTHLAGWQAFQAARNALLPGSSSGVPAIVPWVTFTDPEIAHGGVTEAEARTKYGDTVKIYRAEMNRTDRAICEDETEGFVKLIATRDGTLIGATAVCARAGEVITELVVAMNRRMKMAEVAGIIHAYPTYSTAVQQLAADAAVESAVSGLSGTIVRALAGFRKQEIA